jgi:hypothetical protein
MITIVDAIMACALFCFHHTIISTTQLNTIPERLLQENMHLWGLLCERSWWEEKKTGGMLRGY